MRKKVLIIDDEEDILDLVKNRLEPKNYSVITAKDGLEGISKLEEERPDVVILDIRMPFIDGFKFVKIMKKYEAFKSIPVIVFTARTGMQDEFRTIGVNEYIMKPFDPVELINKLEDVMLQRMKAEKGKKLLN